MKRFGPPPRYPLNERQKKLVGGIVGIGAIVIGVFFLVGPRVDYAPGDYRGTTAFAVLSGGLAITIGVFVLAWAFSGRRIRKDR